MYIVKCKCLYITCISLCLAMKLPYTPQLMNPQADTNCHSRCVEQGIPYVRLSPPLQEEVDSAETDNEKLVDMLWVTRQYLHTARDDATLNKMQTISNTLLHLS